jgi:hypothetical protein
MKKAKRDNPRNCWAIAYVDVEKVQSINRELRKYPQYDDVVPYIPYLRILRKKFKGKPVYDRVPLVFDYGFFSIPRKKAINIEYLNYLQRDVSCITGWVLDSANRLIPRTYAINENYLDCHIPVATATSEKIRELRELERANTVCSGKEMLELQPGAVVNLKGFPFDNMDAEIISVSSKHQSAEVYLMAGNDQIKRVTVALENIFFTLHKNYHTQGANQEVSVQDSPSIQRLVDKAYYNMQARYI